MIYRLPEIVERVRMAMGRGASPRPMIHCRDPDVVDLDAIIASRISQGVEKAYLEAPADRLREASRDFSGQGIYWHECADGTWSGHVALPDDFLRLVVFGMSDWSRPVFDAVDCRSARGGLVASRFCGVRGSPQRPVAVLTDMPEGRVLEFHSCYSDSEHIAQAVYCPVPKIDEYGGVDIAESMIHDVADCIAALVTISTKYELRVTK